MARKSFPKDWLVTISGPAGSGKSHCAAKLSDYYGVPCHSSGSIFRKLASERRLTLEQLSDLAEANPEIDKEIDRRTEDYAKTGGCILEGRLVFWFSGKRKKLSFYLAAPFETRVGRIAEREGISLEEAESKTRAREESERERYLSTYGIDINNLSGYDFVINTAVWDKDAIVELLEWIIDRYFENRRLGGGASR